MFGGIETMQLTLKSEAQRVSYRSGGNPGLIPESGRSPREGMANHSSTLAWKIPWTEDHVLSYSPWGHKESDMTG